MKRWNKETRIQEMSQTLVLRHIHNFQNTKKFSYQRTLNQTLIVNQQQCWTDTSS